MAGFDVVSFAASNSYTDETVEGGGAIKGKNCVIDSIDDITGGHKVNFKWTLDDGTELEASMNVMDGQNGTDGVTPSFSIGTVEKGNDAEASITGTDANPVLNLVLPKGEQGVSITGATIDSNRHLILERSGDASDLDAGQLVENIHTYSTEEHVVGTWIDGKPIYESTFHCNNFNVSDTISYTNIRLKAGIDQCISATGTMLWDYDQPYANKLRLPFIMCLNAGFINIDIIENANSDYFQIRAWRSSGSTNVGDVYVTLQYTKTTD